MMVRLHVAVECGVVTCSSATGQFCRYFGTRKFGQQPVCTLFPGRDGTATDLHEQDGKAMRCPACLAAAELPWAT